MALTLPTMLYEIAFATAPLADTPTWEDITEFVLHCSIKRGRNHELARMEAGTCTLLLNNRDRRFDPTWTGGPYGANVLPLRKLRVSATYGGTTYRLFTGYIEAWPVQWPDQADSKIEVEAVDGFKILNLRKIAGTEYSDTVSATSGLIAYYRLNETLGQTTMVDVAAGHDGLYGGAVDYGLAGAMPAEPDSAIDFGYYTGWASGPGSWGPFSGTGNFSIEMWVLPRTVDPGGIDRVFHQGDGNSGPYGTSNSVLVFVKSDFTIEFVVWDGTPNGGILDSSVALIPYAWNHVVLVKSGTTGPGNWHIYINGSLADGGTTTFGTGNANVVATRFNLASNPQYLAASEPKFDGGLDEVALYNVALSGATVADHYSKVASFTEPALAGVRMDDILDAIGWPAADRDIDAGQFLMRPISEPLWTTESLAYLLDLVDSEGFPAVAYIDGEGKFVFQDRAHSTPSSSGTFGDSTGQLRYELGGTQPVMDDSDWWREVVYQAENGQVQKVRDASLTSDDVVQTLEKSGLKNASDADVLTMATADLARYEDPQVRVREMLIHPLDDEATLYPQVLGSDINSRKTVGRSTIPGGGSGWSADVRIEGLEHDIDHDLGDWHTKWQLAPT